ncbi:NAD(P)-binding protein [Aspergillus desertorum]
MSAPTVVFITGVRQGIGLALLKAYLSRPNHHVIGSVRNSDSNHSLLTLPKASETQFTIVHIESVSSSDPARVLRLLQDMGVSHIDVFIANAGGAPPNEPLDTVSTYNLMTAFHINAASVIRLFQTFRPLLMKSERTPKWISVSSRAGSIGLMGEQGSFFAPAYGASKAALNWFTEALHHTHEWLVVLNIHPGHVRTELGNRAARAMGIEEAPTTVDESATGVIMLIDQATRETISGKFIDAISREEISW